MKSHVWSLWGRKFIIDGSVSSTGKGYKVGEWEYTVHVNENGEWRPVKEDVAVGVLLSFLRRTDPQGKETVLETYVPEPIRKMIEEVRKQFAGRDAEANAYALCITCSQRSGLLESGNLRMC